MSDVESCAASGPVFDLLGEISWYCGNSNSNTHRVGQLRPNPFGLHDMMGNVSEWTSGWAGMLFGGGVDPAGPAGGTLRYTRGGNYTHNYWFVRLVTREQNRHAYEPDYRYRTNGFRLVRTVY